MDPHFWRWAAPWPLFALLFAAAAVVVARRARIRVSATLWFATTAALSALYTVALWRTLPPDLLPWGRLLLGTLILFGVPTGAATAVAVAVRARAAPLPHLAWHLAATATAALLALLGGAFAVLQLFDVVHAVQ